MPDTTFRHGEFQFPLLGRIHHGHQRLANRNRAFQEGLFHFPLHYHRTGNRAADLQVLFLLLDNHQLLAKRIKPLIELKDLSGDLDSVSGRKS